MFHKDEKTQTIVAIANLVAQGLVTQTKIGICITDKGWKVAAAKWEKFTDEEKLLMGVFWKSWNAT